MWQFTHKEVYWDYVVLSLEFSHGYNQLFAIMPVTLTTSHGCIHLTHEQGAFESTVGLWIMFTMCTISLYSLMQ